VLTHLFTGPRPGEVSTTIPVCGAGPVELPVRPDVGREKQMKHVDFLRFEDRGLGLAAVFEEFGREFCLCEESLQMRIENLKAQNIPCDAEMAALAELRRRLAA
jgi:hypothetical protein